MSRRFVEAGGALLLLGAIRASAAPPAVLWSGALPRMPEAGEEIVVTTAATGLRYAGLRRVEGGGDLNTAVPIGAPLLPAAYAVAFGAEERCSLRKGEGELRIECSAGAKPAGVFLVFGDRHVPRGAVVDLAVRSSGDGEFRLTIGRPESDVAAPRAVRSPNMSSALPPGHDDGALQLNFIAPKAGGTLTLRDVRLAASAVATTRSGAWSWDDRAWLAHPEMLVADAKRRGLDRLFVAIPIVAGAVRDPAKLRGFLRDARAAGIGVDAVEGDPDMVDGEGLAAAVARARAIRAFQAEAPPGERLSGVQYDIEPYIRPGWRDREDSYLAWADSILTLSRTLGATVDLVAPFWLASTERGRIMLDRAAPAVRMVTVMAYRTDPVTIERVAEPALAWASRRGKPLRIALESGRLDDETETRYVEATRGTLALVPGDAPRLMLLDAAGTLPGARMFEATGRTHIRAATLSFLGDEATMVRDAAQLRPVFGAWPQFAGFAFHGLRWPAAPNQ